jgi:3-oxoadipate enol-lactonase
MPFMEQGDLRLYYEDSGGDQLAILFLHGGGGCHLSWWQQVPAFEGQYRCVTVDQRGFGQSVNQGPEPAKLANDTLALLDHLGLKRVAVVAQSMGGWTAVGAAVQQPERFWAIVLADTVGNLTDPDIAAVQEKMLDTYPAVLAKHRNPEGRAWPAGLSEGFQQRNPARTFLFGQIASLNPPPPDPGAFFKELYYKVTTPVASYDQTGIPTLFVTGTEDCLIWPELSALVQSKVPESRLWRVPDTGHSVYYERPEGFNQEVSAFLQAHRPHP